MIWVTKHQHQLNVTFSNLFLDEFYTTMYRPYEDTDYNMPMTYEDGLSPSEVLLDRIFGESLQVCSILTMTYIYEIAFKLKTTIAMKWNSTSINITFSGIARTGVKVETNEAQNQWCFSVLSKCMHSSAIKKLLSFPTILDHFRTNIYPLTKGIYLYNIHCVLFTSILM